MKKSYIEFLFSLFVIFKCVLSAPEEDLITYLPGLNHVLTFKHYSGYLNGSIGHHLHYWFVESSSEPSTDPVILWLNGGPGCSSLDGLFNELGPYHISEDGTTLYMNKFSWNTVANVLFLESPVCVGFSYKDGDDCTISDDETADSNYLALKDFFDKNLVKYCCKSGIENEEKCAFASSIWANCDTYASEAMDIIFNEGLNMYNLYGECLHPKTNDTFTSRYYYDKNNLFFKKRQSMLQQSKFANLLTALKLDPPCTDATNMRTYLNNKEVQEAIHVKPTTWDICTDEVNFNYKTQYKSMRKFYEYLVPRVKGLIYNGDVDMACNFLGDEWFAESLNLKLVKERRMWHYDDQVAGFVKQFQNLDVVTVRGSGHMVPQDKPGPALKMITSFIKGSAY
ncbi:Lysosomal protective protein [Armadillidium vulgare]|nr:Lysosomal protective protein [Armadillidium vulgare]